MLPRALRRDDHRVRALLEAALQRGQQAAFAVELERRFRDEHEIGLAQGKGRLRRDEAGLAPHELDEADPVGRAERFHVRAADGLGRLVHGGVEAEGLGNEVDVVVDGLGDADDGNAQVAQTYFLGDGRSRLHGTVAADDEEHAHVEPFKRVHDFGGVLRPARGAEQRPAELVDVLHAGRGQFHNIVAVGGDEALKPVADAEHRRGVIGMVGFQHDGPDHVVEARAEAAAGDDGAFGLAGIEIELPARPGLLKKEGLGLLQVFVVFVSQAQQNLARIEHPLVVHEGRGDFGRAECGDGDIADSEAIFRRHGVLRDSVQFDWRRWRAKQLVRMPPACATLRESKSRNMGICTR